MLPPSWRGLARQLREIPITQRCTMSEHIINAGNLSSAKRYSFQSLAHRSSNINQVTTKSGRLSTRSEATTSLRMASAIMGANFLGVEHAVKQFRLRPSKKVLTALEEIPFSRSVLEARKDDHILVALLPISILGIQATVNRCLFCFKSDQWYRTEAFAAHKGCHVHWALLRKNIILNSTTKTWRQQKAMLSTTETIPTAHMMVYTIILHYLVTDTRLLPTLYARCRDIASFGPRVDIGHFDDRGLRICNSQDVDSYCNIGVMSSRKPTLS